MDYSKGASRDRRICGRRLTILVVRCLGGHVIRGIIYWVIVYGGVLAEIAGQQDMEERLPYDLLRSGL